MAKAWVHAESSARKWGGVAADYLEIHLLMDSGKAAFPSHLHRALTHQSWFIATILPRIFGHTFVNSDGRTVSTVDVGEQHVLEDFGMKFIPTPQDYLEGAEYRPWMNNGRGVPPSHARLAGRNASRPTFEILDGESPEAPARYPSPASGSPGSPHYSD